MKTAYAAALTRHAAKPHASAEVVVYEDAHVRLCRAGNSLRQYSKPKPGQRVAIIFHAPKN